MCVHACLFASLAKLALLLVEKKKSTCTNEMNKHGQELKKNTLFSVGYLLIFLSHETRKKNFHLPVVVLKAKRGGWRKIGEKSTLKLRN